MLLLTIGLLPLVLSCAAHNCKPGPKIKSLKTHGCPGAAWTYGPSEFTFVQGRKHSSILRRKIVKGESMYVYRVKNKLTIGQTVYINGIADNKFKNFEVNFISKSPAINTATSKVVLHANIDYDKGSVIFSSLMNGTWHDANLPLEKLPIQPGKHFDIRIRILENKYEILFDGKKVFDFKHLIPNSAIDYVNAKGDIKLTEFRVGGRIFDTPLDIAFPGDHLKLNDRVIIYGRPTGDGFGVNLIDKNKEIAMFNARCDGKKVVYNCGEIGKFVFDDRESYGFFPFDNETEFKLELVNAANGLAIFVNGKKFDTYNYRKPNATTDYERILITSSVEVHAFEICTQ